MKTDLAELIHRGGVFTDVEGSNPEEIFRNVCDAENFPAEISKDAVFNALCSREKIMSTAVGHGIALPHASAPIIKDENNQRIIVVYLKNPLDMKAPDELSVNTMFIILTQNRQCHLEVLSSLVTLFGDVKFRKLLERHGSEEEIIAALKESDAGNGEK